MLSKIDMKISEGKTKTPMSPSRRRRCLQTGDIAAVGSFLTPTRRKTMEQESFNPFGDLEIVPSKSSSHNDFDFYIGKWKIHNRKLKTRLNNCREWVEFEAMDDCYKILKGFGNINQYRTTFDGVPFEGMTLRLFNPKTKLWSLYWADSNAVALDVPQVGSFDGNIGKFYARDVFQGKDIIVLFQWDKTNPDVPVWSQAFSPDNGKTWEWNWYMTAYRQT